MAFVEAEFPRTIGFKAMGGPTFNTTINEGFSGFEARNQNWIVARGEWEVSLTTPAEEITSPLEFIQQLQAFFLIVAGRENGFRLKDHKDFNNGSSAQFIGSGTGAAGTFQLQKTYQSGGYSYVRQIYKPITSSVLDYQNNSLADTVAVYAGGVLQTAAPAYKEAANTKYSLDYTTGQVTFRTYTTVSGITSVTNPSGDGVTWVYQYTSSSGGPVAVNRQITTSNCGTGGASGNNGTFVITAVNPALNQFTISNASGATQTGLTGSGLMFVTELKVITAVANVSGSQWRYTYTTTGGNVVGDALTSGMRITVAGMQHAANNGVFYIINTGVGTFDVVNASGAAESGSTGTGFSDWVPNTAVLLTATFQYHYPVRFDTDQLQIRLDESPVLTAPIITWASIKMRELRLINGIQG